MTGDPGRVRIRTLGTIEVLSEQALTTDVVAPHRKRFVLAVYLAIEGGLHRRDVLARLLWPDLDRPRALTAVRQAIHFLKTEAGVAFTTEGQTAVGVDRELVRCDAAELIAAELAGDRAKIAGLYNGPFLDGFEVPDAHPDFGFWIDEQRARFRKLARSALLDLSKRAWESDDPDDAREWAVRATRVSPVDELASRALISALLETGNRVGALEEYRRLAAKMRSDLGLEPSHETRSLLASVGSRASVGTARPVLRSSEIPLSRSRLIGRDLEVAEVLRLLQIEHTKLLTITGVGGVGKSRVAMEVARQIVDDGLQRVSFIDLSACEGGTEAIGLISSRFELERSLTTQRQLCAGLVEKLRAEPEVLVLDNVEHVVADIAPLVAEILDNARAARVLVTSTCPLRIEGEHVCRIPPLQLPVAGEITTRPLTDYGAVALFVDRAQSRAQKTQWSDDELHNVVEICRRLDGLPIAIELVAARARVFATFDLLRLLAESSALVLRGDPSGPERHQSLSGLMDWSYALLTDPQKQLLHAISCFRGGGSLDAIRGVWARGAEGEVLDHLTALVDNNLVLAAVADGETRYTMLRTVAEFGRQRCEVASSQIDWRSHHAEYFAKWITEGALEAFCTDREKEFLRRIDREHGNLIQAIAWSCANGEWDVAARIAATMQYYWWARGETATGLKWIELLLAERRGGSVDLIADLLLGRGALVWAVDDVDTASRCMTEAIQLYRISGNARGEARALQNLGELQRHMGSWTSARESFTRVLEIAEELGEPMRKAVALESLGTVLRHDGDLFQAVAYLEESLTLSKANGYTRQTANALFQLGVLAANQGEFHQAINLLKKSRSTFDDLGLSLNSGYALEEIGTARRAVADPAGARRDLVAALTYLAKVGSGVAMARCLLQIAEIDIDQNEWHRALEIASTLSADEDLASQAAIGEDFSLRLAALVQQLRDQLPPERFGSGWAEGRVLDLDELVERVTAEADVVRLRAASS